MKLYIFFILFFSNLSLLAFPGDQDPLVCSFSFKPNAMNNEDALAARQDVFDQGLSKGKYAYGGIFQQGKDYKDMTEEKYHAEMKKQAETRFKKAVRSFHDLNYGHTKLGDSISDFVDFYGVVVGKETHR